MRRGNAKEGVSVLMSERIWLYVKEIRRVSSRIMRVGICIKEEFWSVIVLYAAGMERSEEERDGFWEQLKGCIAICEDRGKVMVIVDTNATVGVSEMEGVVGKFRASRLNENGRKLIELSAEKKLSAGNKFFEEEDILKFTWVSGVDGHKSLLDLIVVPE